MHRAKLRCTNRLVLASLVVLIAHSASVFATEPPNNGFAYPVGPRDNKDVTPTNDGDGWYNAQDFGELNSEIRPAMDLLHAGEDWNGECVFDTGDGGCDAGEPVYAVAHGTIFEIRDLGSIGELVVIRHEIAADDIVFSVYLHIVPDCGLQEGERVARNQPIGKIAPITSLAPHLHFEVRDIPVEIGDLYENDFDGSGYFLSMEDLKAEGLTDPSEFVDARPVPLDTPPAIDVYLVVDLSSSFSDDLPIFKDAAPASMTFLQILNPNMRFGLATFEDYPIIPFGSSSSGDKAYRQESDLTFDVAELSSKIDGLSTRFGFDTPESQYAALYQAATGAGQDLSALGFENASIPSCMHASFRDGAEKIFLPWTDAPFHAPGDSGSIPYPGPSHTETINAIKALDPPKIVGISSGDSALPHLARLARDTETFAPEGGVDCNKDGVVDVPEGAPLVCAIPPSGEGIGEAILATVEAAADPANRSPLAQCKDALVIASDTCGAAASVDDGSFDPDGGEISIEQTPPGPYSLGDTEVSLTVTDENGAADSCTGTVTVVDRTAPSIRSVKASPSLLWPPNHKMVPIDIGVEVKDNCDPNPACSISSIQSDQAMNAQGDGATPSDWEIVNRFEVLIRAERSGGATDGREYSVGTRCVDSSENDSVASVTVRVAHDRRKSR